MQILVTVVFLTGVLCCYAVPEGEKFKEEDKISSHHEQQLGYRHEIHNGNQREHRSFQENKSAWDDRQHPANYTSTQIPSQLSNERQQTSVRDQWTQDSNQNQKQRLHYDVQDLSVLQPHQHQPQRQQPQQRNEMYTQPPSPTPSPQHRHHHSPPTSRHRQLPPALHSSHRRLDRPSLSPNRNLDNAQQTKQVQTIPGNGEPQSSGESDSFVRNGSRPISADDIFRRLPHRYEVNDQHNVKTFYNNDRKSPHQGLPFKESYLLGESAETTSDEVSGLEEEEQSTSKHRHEEPYFFDGDYHDESQSEEESVSVFAYTESSVQPVNTSTVNYPEPLSFVETDAYRFESHQPDLAPNVGYTHLRRQLEDITRKRNTSSIQIQENEDAIKKGLDDGFSNNRYVQREGRGDGEPTPTSLHDGESDEDTEVFEHSSYVSETDELGHQTLGEDSGHLNETSHPIRFSTKNDGELTSSRIGSQNLDRRSISRHQSGQRRFQRPLPNSPSPDQRARNRKPQISTRKQLAQYSDTRSIVSPLFNSTFSKDELNPSNSGDFDSIDLTKAEPTIKTRPSFHIKSDFIADFTTANDSKENPSRSIVDEIVAYSKSNKGLSDLEAGFVGPENRPGRKYSYSYVNHYIAPTPNTYRTTEKQNFEFDDDAQITTPRTHVDERILVPPPGDRAHQRPNETLKDSVIGEYSDSFPTIVKDPVFPVETTQIESETTSIISATTTTTTTTTSTTTPETTTTTSTTSSTEPNSSFSFLLDRASGTLIATESPNPHTIQTSPLPTSKPYESTTPSTPAVSTPESLLNQLPPNLFSNQAGLSTNFSTANWNQGSGVQSNLNAHNPFAYRLPQSHSFQSNAQSQSSPLGSTGSNLFGLSNLLGLGTLSGLPGFGQSTPAQPGATNLGFTSAPISHLASSSNSNSGQQGGSSLDLGGLGYLSLLTAGLGGLNLSPQSGLDLSSFGSGGGQQSQAFSNPFQQIPTGSGSGQPENSLVQQILKQFGGGGSLSNQNPFGYTSSLGQNPYAIHPQTLSLGAASAPSLLPATYDTGSVQPIVAAPAAASSSSNSGSSSIRTDSAVPEGK